jgi:hypothetical protein
MEVFAGRIGGKVGNRISHGSPSWQIVGLETSPRRIDVRLRRRRGHTASQPDYDSPLAGLRGPIVRCIQYPGPDLKAEFFRSLAYLDVLLGFQEGLNILHDECGWQCVFYGPEEMTPELPARIVRDTFPKVAESLAGRTADHNIGAGKLLDFLDGALRNPIRNVRA